jgi:Fur family ferric uptake transcriptional regulator
VTKGRKESTIAQLIEQINARLREAQIRLTRGRREVVDALARARGPVSAAEIRIHLDGAVPLSSIYRTLGVLTQTDVASLHHSRDGVTRYELAEPLQHHHHHLVCISCGRIDDVEFSAEAEATVHAVVSGVASDRGFRAVNHALEIEGTCEECS